MPTNRKVIDFKIHNLTEEQFQELKEAGQIDPNAIYCTPDETVVNFEKINKEIEALKDKGGFPLLTAMWADHTLNDISWLNADTFSWQSGDVYEAAYNHLAEEYEADTTLGGQTETIAGVTTYFRLAADGHKIVPANQEATVQAIYEATGVAWYYILDQENKQFKLPRERSKKLIRSYNDGYTWYRLYADGWVEQGGKWTGNLTISQGQEVTPTVTLPVPVRFGNVDATTKGLYCLPMGYDFTANNKLRIRFGAYTVNRTLTEFDWSVSGMATTTPEQNDRLYFYVGNFERDAIEQTAGLSAELFNSKADKATVDGQFESAKINYVPSGVVSAFAGKNPPTGWLKCDGSAVSRTTYAKLFAAIGQIYGGGDGSTTFNLPNLTGRVPFGMDGNYVGQSTYGSLPNVTGSIAGAGGGNYSASGAFTSSPSNSQGWGNASGTNYFNFSFNASRSSSIYGGSWFSGERVVPASVGMTYCIKY